MCGFAGAFSFQSSGDRFHALTSAATYTLLHRGPDDEGLVFKPSYSVGHRRLKIIDLSAHAHQPMLDTEGRYVIAFNGEVYNFKTLRSELEKLGCSFKSQSDTEVILQGFMRWGNEIFERIRGEFAIALYDNKHEELTLVRDQFGIKPLYYFQNEEVLLFASELRGLLAYGIPKTIDTTALNLYFHLNYIPAPYSIFEGIRKLEKGSIHTISKTKSESTPLSSHPPQQSVTTLLEHSVEERLNADVPVGTFLSGGIDSTIITGIAAKKHPGIHAFSIGFPDQPFFNETEYATIAANAFNVRHQVIEVRQPELMGAMGALFDHLDEPFADSSALPFYLLCKFAANHVKVVLSGDGADELFGGYNKHEAEYRLSTLKIPAFAARTGKEILEALPASRNSKTGNTIRKATKFLKASLLSRPERYWMMAGFPEGREILRQEQKYTSAQWETLRKPFLCGPGKDMNDIFEADLKLVLENDMLVKADRMSMAHSLEVRVPFLDQDLSAMVRNCSASEKIGPQGRKIMLKEAYQDLIPPRLLNRPKKGFEVPLVGWFRSELQPLLSEEIGDQHFLQQQGLFEQEELRRLNQQLFTARPGDAAATLWAFLVFQHWYRNYFLR